MHAHKVSTATLNICGALDRCTPSEEARQFHSALVENGVESILVTYPEEGHGVRKLPASVDYAARLRPCIPTIGIHDKRRDLAIPAKRQHPREAGRYQKACDHIAHGPLR